MIRVKMSSVLLRTSRKLHYLCDIGQKTLRNLHGQELTPANLSVRFQTGHETLVSWVKVCCLSGLSLFKLRQVKLISPSPFVHFENM